MNYYCFNNIQILNLINGLIDILIIIIPAFLSGDVIDRQSYIDAYKKAYGKTIEGLETQIARKVGTIDLYKASHHLDSNDSSSQSVLNILNPKYCVVTKNPANSNAKAVGRIKAKVGNNIYYNSNGNIVASFSNGAISISQ